MSDDEADPELLELLRKSLGIGKKTNEITSETNVLRDAEYIYSNAIDVAIDRNGTVAAAETIWQEMQHRVYSRSAWSEHELHPKAKDEATLNFIFTMDLLNFSFWSDLPEEKRWSVLYRYKRWTGYWSLVAALRRALDEGIPITSPSFWLEQEELVGSQGADIQGERASDEVSEAIDVDGQRRDVSNGDETANKDSNGLENPGGFEAMDVEDEDGAKSRDAPEMLDLATQNEDQEVNSSELSKLTIGENTLAVRSPHLTEEIMKQVFRGEGDEEMPLLQERLSVLRQAGQVLEDEFEGSVAKLIERADGSAGKLVNLLAHHFECFRDQATFDRKKVCFLKRAQIFVADVWAAFDGQSYGSFDDIDRLTMFADYRVPQQLHSLGCISYSPKLDYVVRSQQMIPSGSSWECQLRGCSIWVVEMIRRRIKSTHPDAEINAVLIDFFLYDLAKEREREGAEAIPHHRTRSIWY
ncbi:hypothetical protein C1H76_8010 [Elsinoe australis]|uniref:Queuosine 5'-phosphate N-glycosylase/hydrolase n=1 Tax=Elsinoe australis TaxID=40998 RepID=A0A4V6DTA2_9PEZI|nr:hypothetical protein C1H76_8010 [Elsinoe australis]